MISCTVSVDQVQRRDELREKNPLRLHVQTCDSSPKDFRINERNPVIISDRCCVRKCGRQSHNCFGRNISNGLSFYRFPAWRANEGERVDELTRRQREAWLVAVGRTDIPFNRILSFMRVCSRHFHSGKPADVVMESDPDWAPSLNLDPQEENTQKPEILRPSSKLQTTTKKKQQRFSDGTQSDPDWVPSLNLDLQEESVQDAEVFTLSSKPQTRKMQQRQKSTSSRPAMAAEVEKRSTAVTEDGTNESPQQNDFKQEEDVEDPQLLNQERNLILVQVERAPSQIKEEQEELCISQEGEQFVLKQETESFNEDLLQQHECKQEEVLADQQLWNQERNNSLDQEEPEPLQVKEERDEVSINQEGVPLVQKQEPDSFMVTSTYEENDHREAEPNDLKMNAASFYGKPAGGPRPRAPPVDSDDSCLSESGDSDEEYTPEPGDENGSSSEWTGSDEDADGTHNAPQSTSAAVARGKPAAPPKRKRQKVAWKTVKQQNSAKEVPVCNAMAEVFNDNVAESRPLPLPLLPDASQQHDFNEKVLIVQERNSSLDQERPDNAGSKGVEREPCSSQEEEHFGLMQETVTFVVTSINVDSNNRETEPMSEQLLSHSSPNTESKDQGADGPKTYSGPRELVKEMESWGLEVATGNTVEEELMESRIQTVEKEVETLVCECVEMENNMKPSYYMVSEVPNPVTKNVGGPEEEGQ
ncbi:uncharacterized protein KZ484_008855 [Pholidichthys leucotaenia]